MVAPPRVAGPGGRLTLWDDWPTLGEVLANLDVDVLREVCAPDRGRAAVTDAVVFDPTDPHGVHPGAIVLAVGLSGAEGEAAALVDAAGRGGAAAVVLRCDDELPARLVEIAEESRVGLLTVPLEMAWGQLYSFLRTAILSAGAAGRSEPSGIPVGSLFALADAVAAAVGGPVTIEDPQMRVLAYSNLAQSIDDARRQTILGRTPPPLWQRRLEEAGVPHALRRGDGIVRFGGFEDEGLAPRLAAPVRVGGELLGAIWVAEAGTPLGAAAERELLQAAEAAVAHLLAHQAFEDVKRRARGALVRELLEGREASASSAPAGFAADGPFTTLVFEPATGESVLSGGNPERVLSVVGLYCEHAHRDAMCALVDERFWVVLPTHHDDVRARTVALARKVVDRVRRALHVRLVAAIGQSVERVADIPLSRRSAERALEVRVRRGLAHPVLHYEDVRSQSVLLELLDFAAQLLPASSSSGRVTVLRAHDRKHGTRYTATLRTYLDCSREVTRTAARLCVHPNTLRYRLRRIVAMSGLDLDDPDERLLTELELKLGDL